MVENLKKDVKKINNVQGKENDILSTLWDSIFEKFFENYKKFDELWLLLCKNNDVIIYSEHVLLDAEISWKLHNEFFEAFINSIKSIVGEEIFKRMEIFFENNDYLLSNEKKRFDGDPFLDDKFKIITMWDSTVAQFIERRNTFNNVEFHYIVYPKRILKFIQKLLKR